MKPLLEAIRPTTFIKPESLSEMLGIDITFSSETFQRTGSFKFRAAYNSALNTKSKHIITASSGNFGQALALACRLLGKRCHVVMPNTSASVKISAVRSQGAEVALIDIAKISREDRVSELMAEFPEAQRASPYDDVNVIEGNASLGDEIAHYGEFDIVVAPVGGGGLISGVSKGLRRQGSKAMLFGAEPALANDAARSLEAGRLISNESEPQTLADGARTLSLGEKNWEIIREDVSRILEITEGGIRRGVYHCFSSANLKVEPTAALSVAALLENQNVFERKKVCCVISGGNVDPKLYSEIVISQAQP